MRLSHHQAYGSRTWRFVKHSTIALYTNHTFPLLLSIGYTKVFLYEFSLHNTACPVLDTGFSPSSAREYSNLIPKVLAHVLLTTMTYCWHSTGLLTSWLIETESIPRPPQSLSRFYGIRAYSLPSVRQASSDSCSIYHLEIVGQGLHKDPAEDGTSCACSPSLNGLRMLFLFPAMRDRLSAPDFVVRFPALREAGFTACLTANHLRK